MTNNKYQMKDFMNIKLIILLCLLHIVMSNSASFAQLVAKDKDLEKTLSAEQVVDSDLEKYEKAVGKDPDSDTANYNLGTAYYRKGDYEKSIDSFMKSLNTEDREIEARAIYNIANSKYKMGSLQAGTDLNSAIGHYKESLDYYRRAMELDEADRDAKYNHELVEKKLKILLDKMKNQQQQEKDQEQNEDKDKENKEGEGKGEQQQQQEDQKKQDEEKEQSSQSQDKGESGAEQEQKEQEMQSAGKEEESSEQMSPEEAQMLLEAYGQDEARDEVKQKMKGRYGEVLNDW